MAELGGLQAVRRRMVLDKTCPVCRQVFKRLERLPKGGRACRGCREKVITGQVRAPPPDQRWPALPGQPAKIDGAASMPTKTLPTPTARPAGVQPDLPGVESDAEKYVRMTERLRLMRKQNRILRETQAQAHAAQEKAAEKEIGDFRAAHPGLAAEVRALLADLESQRAWLGTVTKGADE